MVKELQLDFWGGEGRGRMVLELPGREHHRAGQRGASLLMRETMAEEKLNSLRTTH